jgi:hypothetical protein
MKKYFVYDPESIGFELFDTVEERDNAATECIQNYLKDGWDEAVVHVVAGEVTHRATMCEKVDRPPEDEIDEYGMDIEGNSWDGDWNYICGYKMNPIARGK